MMLHAAVRLMITRNDNDGPKIYRLRYGNNHPYFRNVGMAFFREKPEDPNSLFPRFLWLGGPPKKPGGIVRLKNAYDAEG